MKVTIVTVCYNCVSSLENTILSVINQTYHDIEYIIIDGGSSDGSVDVIKKYADKITYWVSEPDKGIYDAMNKGISKATGNFINFMNAGDTFHSNNTVETVVNRITASKQFYYGDTLLMLPNGHKEVRRAFDLSLFSKTLPFCHQSCFASTKYLKANPFDTRYKVHADYNQLYKAWNSNPMSFEYVGEVIANYDMDGLSSDKKYLREKYLIWNLPKYSIKKLPIEFRILFWKLIPKALGLKIHEIRIKQVNKK